MKLTLDDNSNAYEVVEKIVLEKYKNRGESIIVQLRLKYGYEQKYYKITTLLLNDGEDCFRPKWVWEYDWWEGEQDVELIAAAPISDIDISETFAIS